jgi:deoxyribodipyrimidine photo-lyase
LGLEPTIDWAGGLRETWSPGENGAKKRLREFLRDCLASYTEDRHRVDEVGTSMLSPHLHFGEIAPRRIWHEVQDTILQGGSKKTGDGARTFLSEIGWREYAHHLLFHFPQTPESPLKKQFASFPWKRNSNLLSAWQQGRTGYPIVDAAVRHLWATGWMPNRARMIVASFLTKDLLIPWQEGAKWFWDTLVDADLANNTLGWQWTAGCGADAAPFFRIFNPVTQGEKFDPKGKYVRDWVPELESVPDRWVHKPWGAPEGHGEGTKRGYPPPIVDHAEARVRALQAYESLKATAHP